MQILNDKEKKWLKELEENKTPAAKRANQLSKDYFEASNPSYSNDVIIRASLYFVLIVGGIVGLIWLLFSIF